MDWKTFAASLPSGELAGFADGELAEAEAVERAQVLFPAGRAPGGDRA